MFNLARLLTTLLALNKPFLLFSFLTFACCAIFGQSLNDVGGKERQHLLFARSKRFANIQNYSSITSGFVLPSTNASINSQTRRWYFVGTSVDGTEYYIEKQMRHRSESVLSVWEKLVYKDSSSIVALGEWDCTNNRRRSVQTSIYSSSGDLVKFDQSSTAWAAVPPDTMGESVMELVCGSIDGSTKGRSGDRPLISALPPNLTFFQVSAVNANLRKAPTANAAIVRTVKRGATLMSIAGESSGAWYKVIDPEDVDVELWISRTACREMTSAKPISNPKASNRKTTNKKRRNR